MFVATMVFGLLLVWLVKHFLYLSGDKGSHHEAAAREDKPSALHRASRVVFLLQLVC